ncbi:MAG: carboxypeptidase-like regulatory domain-containing protein, partial [Bryobacteraceae bacterium]
MKFRSTALIWLLAVSALGAADANVSGQVTDPQGKPVADATIAAESRGARARTARSGPDGRFAFASLPAGDCKLLATAPGFADASETIAVTDGAVLTVHLQFVRLAPRTEAVTVTADVSQIDV